MSARSLLGRQWLSHEELAGLRSADYGVPMHEFAARAAREHAEREQSMYLSPKRLAAYDEHGGPVGYAAHVGAGQEHDYRPVEVSPHDDGRTVYVTDGHHRVLDAMARKLPRVPVSWVD